jgi:DNA protecting protein DprA
VTKVDRERFLATLSAANDIQASHWSRWEPSNSVGSPLPSWDEGAEDEEALQERVRAWAEGIGDWNAEVDRAEEALETLWASDVETLAITDSAYPPQLRSIPHPPLILHVKGDRSKLTTGVSVVGTRSADSQALDITARFCEWLAEKGVPVITGLAKGVDEVAARSCLDANGTVIASLPGSPLEVTPKSSADEYRQTAQQGCLVSEVTGRFSITKSSFLRRNRITSGLGKVVVVTAARKTGGTVNQLKWAKRQEIPSIVLEQGAPEGFSQEIRVEETPYHLLDEGQLTEGTTNLWAVPTLSPQTRL